MAVKTFTTGEVLTAADTNTYLNNGGLVYITGGTQSGTTALNVDGCFTDTYLNYRVCLAAVDVSVTDRAVRWNFRAGGSTLGSALYDYAFRGLRANGVSGDTSLGSQTFAEVGIYIATFTNLKLGSVAIDVMNPKVAERSFGLCNAIGYEGGTYQMRQGGFVYNADTACDGFRITLSGTGNVNFKYQVYGYRIA